MLSCVSSLEYDEKTKCTKYNIL